MPDHKNLAEALAAFQAQLPAVAKGATGQVQGRRNYRYADLADVSAVVMPRLAAHGLAFISKPSFNEHGKFVLSFSLLHVSGEREDGQFELGTGNMQQLGSAITYARRYALCAVTGVVPDEDDDGHGATHFSEPVGRGEAPRTNGNTVSADAARQSLRAACEDNGWDMNRVAARFRDQYSEDLKTATDGNRITAFTKLLYGISDAELKPVPA